MSVEWKGVRRCRRVEVQWRRNLGEVMSERKGLERGEGGRGEERGDKSGLRE